MTHAAGGKARRIPRGWLLPLAGLVALLAATAAGLFSRSIIYDFLAWWPVWLLLALLSWLARGKRIKAIKLSGVVPFAVLGVLVLFTAGYWYGWQVMPSAGIRLVGPPGDSADVAALAARIEGDLLVGPADSSFLYEVSPLRKGGEVGGPGATEQVQGLAFAVSIEPVPDPGLYRFNGWELALARNTTWALTLSGVVDANLSGFRLSELKLLGSGTVALGGTSESTPATVDGDYELSIPTGVPVRVIGDATVPEGWEETAQGSRSPTSGDGWVISVGEQSSLTVRSP